MCALSETERMQWVAAISAAATLRNSLTGEELSVAG